jgi:hypothetical protein
MKGMVNGSSRKVSYLPCLPRKEKLVTLGGAGPSGPAYTPMVYQGGPLLSSAELVSFYWGNFTAAEVSTMQSYLQNLAAHISGANPPANQAPVLWQYNCVCAHLGDTYNDPNAPPTSTDTGVKDKVLALQAAGELPPFSPSRLIIVFTKGISFPGYGVSNGWCAYHNYWGTNEYYALVPQPTAAALCATDDNTAWESVTSHEIFEAMTDPIVGTGWIEGTGEGGDSCNFNEAALPFGTVQRFADNSQQTCSIWTPTLPPFWVKPFTPWAGYGMGIGYFLAADINGDGKTDLVHIVAGSNYANVWISNGNGTFSVSSFTPWAGYGMGVGYFLAADINGDGKTDLVHIVAGTNYANVWISNGDGTFNVKQFAPWPGYGMGIGHFVAGDFNGDGKKDLTHIVAGSDYANVWTSLYYGFHC